MAAYEPRPQGRRVPTIDVLDTTMHYLDTDPEAAGGRAIVLLHGNPASSHLWRDIVPRLGPGRRLAPDLVGMGRSGKPDIDYRFADHARHLDAWFDALGLTDVVLVGHDWGGALAFDWAARHPDRVAGVAFLESVVRPIPWDEVSPQARERTEMIRTPGRGEEFVLDGDAFVRAAYTRGVLTPVAEADLQAYLEPFPDRASRRPILAWARQLPIGGEPAEVIARLEAYQPWLAASEDVPKLLMTFEGSPILMIGPAMIDWCEAHIAGLEVVACGAASHHAPEDRSQEIAAAIVAWLDRTR
jgi:haloalkane dehalogenase